MSTYDDEHDLNRDNENVNPQSVNNNNRRLTLQQALDNFLNTPSHSTTSIINFANQGDIPIDPNMAHMLESMLSSTNGIITMDESKQMEGVDESFLDRLERVNTKKLNDDDTCPICTNEYKTDPHPLVVELPCNSKHRFDLECIGPWLKLNKTCPLCRVDVTSKKEKVVIVDSEDEDEDWQMYG